MDKREEFIKAYCPVSKKYFTLKVEKQGLKHYVTDCAPLPADTAEKVSSTIAVPNITTAPNLLPCANCGSRVVAGCKHARSHTEYCREDSCFHYQCIYCDKLQLTEPDEGRTDSGKTVILGNGMKVAISEAGSRAIEEIRVSTYWTTNCDIDASTVLKRGNGYDLVYFGQKTHPSGCVYYRGDNLVGGTVGGESDSERMMLYLRKVPDTCDAIYFVLNIYSGALSFRFVRNLAISLYDTSTNKLLVKYDMQRINPSGKGLIVAKLYKSDGKWMFMSIGKTVHEGDVHKLAEMAIRE